MVRVGVGLIAATVAALAIGTILYAWMTLGGVPANAGLHTGARGLSVFGTIHPTLFDVRAANFGSDVPASPRMRLRASIPGMTPRPR